MTREDELIRKIAQGDLDATDELIAMYYPEILRYCLWHAPNRSLAEDAAQETFLKVIRYFDRYTHKGRFKSFLYQVAANTCVDMRRRHRYADVSLEESAFDIGYAEPAFEDIHSEMAIRQMVNCLPKDLQEIVLLRFGQELTLREIAQVLQMPLRTVQTRLRRALKMLKTQIALSEDKPADKKKQDL